MTTVRMIPDTFGGFDLDDVVKKAEEKKRQEAEKKPAEPPKTEPEKAAAPVVQPVTAPKFGIQEMFGTGPDSTGFAKNYLLYKMENVRMGGNLVDLTLCQKPLPFGLFEKLLGGKTCRRWMTHSQDNLHYDPGPVSLMLYHSIFRELYENRDKPDCRNEVASAKAGIRDIILNHRVVTLTTEGSNSVKHYEGRFVREINGAPNRVEALIGDNRHSDEINEIYNWLLGCNLGWVLPADDGERFVTLKKLYDFVPAMRLDTLKVDTNTSPSKHCYAIGITIQGVK